MDTQGDQGKADDFDAGVTGSRCDRCGEFVSDIDAGFSPGLHAMAHDCGGTWQRCSCEPECVDARCSHGQHRQVPGHRWKHAPSCPARGGPG